MMFRNDGTGLCGLEEFFWRRLEGCAGGESFSPGANGVGQVSFSFGTGGNQIVILQMTTRGSVLLVIWGEASRERQSF